MAMNIDEAEQMYRLAKESELLALIDHELRFANGRRKAFEMIREGAIGKIRHAKYLFRNATRGDASLPWTWWSDIEQGGGALGAIASHVIDSFRWFTEAEITEVNCRLHTHIKHRPQNGELLEVSSDDETLMILKLEGDALVEDATASATISLVEAGPYRNRVEFFGSDGAIRIEDGGDIFRADIQGGVWVPVNIDLGGIAPGMAMGGWSRGFMAFAAKIIDALREGRTEVEGAATFLDGLMIQKVLDASRESDRLKKTITLDYPSA
jgi:predicted dehydrogenase